MSIAVARRRQRRCTMRPLLRALGLFAFGLGVGVVLTRLARQRESEGATDQDPVESPAGRDIVQEASEESFPASDPPAWTPITGVGPPH
jgi:hypothetical protein